MVMKQQLRSMIEILRRKRGTHGKSKWMRNEEHVIGVNFWVNKWEFVARSFTWPTQDDMHRVLEVTGLPPDYWRAHPYAPATEIAQEIKDVLLRL